MMWRSPTLAVGGTILIAVITMSIAAPWIVPYPTTEQHMLDRLKPPGARFVLGTDMGAGFSREHDPTPAYYGWSSHIEMESMVKAGLTPSEVITAATRNSAQLLGLDQLGMVAPGKNADFLVLDANPLDNIANTRRISRVYLRGAEVDRAGLKNRLSGGH